VHVGTNLYRTRPHTIFQVQDPFARLDFCPRLSFLGQVVLANSYGSARFRFDGFFEVDIVPRRSELRTDSAIQIMPLPSRFAQGLPSFLVDKRIFALSTVPTFKAFVKRGTVSRFVSYLSCGRWFPWSPPLCSFLVYSQTFYTL